MIAFDLNCINGHAFEGWFKDAHSFDTQKKKNLLTCPLCESTEVYKIPATFAIKKQFPSSPSKDTQIDLKQAGKKIAEFIDKNFDDVGADFAKEALKMHYGVTEPRNIRGVSTQEEEKLLENEGIRIVKFPKTDSD